MPQTFLCLEHRQRDSIRGGMRTEAEVNGTWPLQNNAETWTGPDTA